MAVADITRILRRMSINSKNLTGIRTPWEIHANSGKVLRVPGAALSSAVSSANGTLGTSRPATPASDSHRGLLKAPELSSHSAAPLIKMQSLPLIDPCVRGFASKAHMKYGKRKKAPVDRFGSLDPSQPRLGFDKVEELENADTTVKKIFSLEFGDGTDLHRTRRKITEDLLRENPDDEDDLAVKIGHITEHIRALAPHVENNKKDSVNKVRMLNAIDRRRKMLKYLRRRNYARFERLLEELGISWSPPPEYYRRQTKRHLQKKAVKAEAWQQRVDALKEFEARWKQEKLLEIARLKEELGKELGEEERRMLERSREETSV